MKPKLTINIVYKNKKGQLHGWQEIYYSDGKLFYKGNYINGKKDGWWEGYYIDGQLWYKGNYKKEKKVGIWIWGSGEIDFYI